MEVVRGSDSPGNNITSPLRELREVGSQVWTFIESQCWDTETGDIHTQNITFWLRTLLQQNSDLVEVVAKLERDAQAQDRQGGALMPYRYVDGWMDSHFGQTTLFGDMMPYK